MTVNWDNLYKIRLSNTSLKHEVVKLLLVKKILEKYPTKDWIRVYTEFELENGLKPDIYFENVKDKAIIIYEIQKDYSDNWLKEKTKQYNEYEVPYFNSVDFIPINLNLFTNDIDEIYEKLEEFVF